MALSISATNLMKRQLAALVLVLAAVFMMATTTKAASMDAAQKKEMEQVIHDYLMNNPEVVIDAIQKYQAQQELAKQADVAKSLTAMSKTFKTDDSFPRTGNKDGDVLFVEFFDYQCGYCKKVFPTVMDVVKNNDDMNVVFVEFPILSKESIVASRAALASRKQGKYMDFHVALMGHRGRLSDEIIMKIAASVGLDVDQLAEDMKSKEIDSQLQRNHQMATALGLKGTPAFVIGDRLAPGAISKEQMQQMIKLARESS